MKFALLHLVALVAPLALLQAAEGPARGVHSVTPPKRREDAFVTGNGRMGAMLFGGLGKEVFVANHCRLFLPLGKREILPELAPHVPELRRIARKQTYGDAQGDHVRLKYPLHGACPSIPTRPSQASRKALLRLRNRHHKCSWATATGPWSMLGKCTPEWASRS